MRSLNSPELYRNMGFWNEPTQQAINDTEVSIAGNGGTGNLYGMELARIGVQNFRVADPEVFDDVNSNRVMGARTDTMGRNKAEVLKEDILAINPDAKVVTYTEGINPDNLEDFLQSADIVLNGLELTRPELGVMLARGARNRQIKGEPSPLPVLDIEYIAHAGQVTAFDPYSKMTFERFMGIKGGEHMPLDEVAEQIIDASRYLAYLPPYGDLKTLVALRNGAPLPSNMIGAGVAAQLGLAETLKHIRARVGEKGKAPIFAPRVRWYDAYTNKSGETSHPQLSHYRHLSKVAFINLVTHRHEPASYTPEERAARGDIA
jgi:molybdopterin/thiamine biosynthesis adenylyltransferase